MLYDLVKKWRGKESVVMTDQLRKVNSEAKRLRDSQRGMKVEYFVRPSEETTEKFKQKPNNHRGD